MKNCFCGYKKENVQRYSYCVAGKTKRRKNEKTRGGGETSQKAKKANNFGKVPQQIISSSAITG